MRFSLEEFRDGASSIGGRLGDVVNGALGAAKRGLCQAYRDYPGWVSGSNLDPLGAASSFRRQLLNGLCDDGVTPYPPEPSLPFTGGQCPVSYNVLGTCKAANNATWGCGESVSWTGSIGGPGITILEENGRARLRNAAGDESPCVMQGASVQSIFTASDCVPRGAGNPFAFEGSVAIGSVVRADGLPDTCGDPPPNYDGGGEPPGGVIDSPQPFTIPANDRGPAITIAPNVRISPNINLPDLNIPVNICLSLLGCIQVSAGGAEGGGDAISPDDLQKLLDGADAIGGIKKKVDDLSKGGEGIGVSPDAGSDGTDKDVSGLLGIFIQITALPVGLGREFGTPDKFNFGRISFKRDGFYSEPLPISFLTNYFPAPEGTNGYALSYRAGVVGSVQVLKREA